MRILVGLFASLFATSVWAKDNSQTLADIKQELAVLNTEVLKLKRELSTTSGAQVTVTGDTLRRIDAIEAALQRQTAAIEAAQNRIDRIVADGTNRIGDISFRLCELEPGCDIATLPEIPVLGGGEAPAVQPQTTEPVSNDTEGVELAVSEKSDFEKAKALLDESKFADASTGFSTFLQNYPGGPLSSDAHFYLGQAYDGLGEWNSAARSFLESFSGSPDAPRAPEALLSLGLTLHKLGQTPEACIMFEEVLTRYPGSEQVKRATEQRGALGCG